MRLAAAGLTPRNDCLKREPIPSLIILGLNYEDLVHALKRDKLVSGNPHQ